MQNQWSKSESGFTLLELLTVLAIIGVTALFALPGFQEWNAKRTFDRSFNDIYSVVSSARLQSFTRSTTVKIATSSSGDVYTMITYANSSNTSTCATGAGWTQLSSKTVTLNSNFQLTGSGVGNVCFYRDGSASGGAYNLTQKNGTSTLGNASINVILATGFVDVAKN